MAVIGNTDITGMGAGGIEEQVNGTPITMPENGTAQSIWIYAAESIDNNAHTFRAGLFDASQNLLEQSSSRNDLTTTPGWYEFTGFTTALTASTQYFIALATNAASGNFNIWFLSGSSGDSYRDFSPTTPGSFDDPENMGSASEKLAMYLEYTTGGSVAQKRMTLLGVG